MDALFIYSNRAIVTAFKVEATLLVVEFLSGSSSWVDCSSNWTLANAHPSNSVSDKTQKQSIWAVSGLTMRKKENLAMIL